MLGGQGHIPVRIMTIGGMSSKIQWSLKAAPGLHHCTVMPIISLQQNYDNNTRYKRSTRLVPICTFDFRNILPCIEIYIDLLLIVGDGKTDDDGVG